MARMLFLAAAGLAVLAFATPVLADTPANCTYGEFLGKWQVTLSAELPAPTHPSLDCNISFVGASTFQVTLAFPNHVAASGLPVAPGNWTLIYNQGIEFWLGNNVGFAYADFDGAGDDLCKHSSVGYYHSRDAQQWHCMTMSKLSDAPHSAAAVARAFERSSVNHVPKDVAAVTAEARAERLTDEERLNSIFTTDHAFLHAVNKAAKGMFTVGEYPEWNGMTIRDLERRRGSSLAHALPLHMQLPAKQVHRAPRLHASAIPDSFDWRNVSGVNYVSPVRDQGQCGSCYSFSSAGMLEARIRIRTNNTQQPILSPQDVVSCGLYSQGCEGGFPYLVAGKYAHDYGMAEEACYPYEGVDSQCAPKPTDACNPKRWKSEQYYYIGGYYGQSNAQVMQEEIMANGPISVSFQVYDDFMHYKGGVYSHKYAAALQLDDYNPFEIVGHAVLCVGWGVTADESATPYWIVKNSWNERWGEQGYFRILRNGHNGGQPGGESAIESITVAAHPII